MNLSKLPTIGISGSLFTIESGALKGRERAFVGQDYVQAISQAGGVPIILPVINSEDAISKYVELIDGLVLSGGYDVHPHFYGEEPHPLLDASYPDRDDFEIKLTHLTQQVRKPILGICRGLQILNVAFGGTLYQDLTLHSSDTLQHNQKVRIDHPIHTVKLEEGTILREIMNQSSIGTNSLHHQSIRLLANGFIVNARTTDGIIEGIEKMDESFILAIQWHPELMYERDEKMFQLFHAFIRASSRKGILV